MPKCPLEHKGFKKNTQATVIRGPFIIDVQEFPLSLAGTPERWVKEYSFAMA
jgi:hypothetical protein